LLARAGVPRAGGEAGRRRHQGGDGGVTVDALCTT
jgi:hypothetical protein